MTLPPAGPGRADSGMSRATLAHYVVLCGADRFGDTLRYSGLTIVSAVAYGDAWLLTALGLARFLPWLLAGPAAGVLADRLGNHRVAVRANVVKAVTTAALAVAIVAHAPAAVLVLAAAVTSVAGVALDAATSSWLPRLVGPDELATANSRLSTVQSVSSLLAPTLAGVAVTTASGLFYALALVAAVAVAALELGAMSGADPREGHRRLAEVSMTAAVRVGFAGLASLWGDRSLRPLTVAIQLLNVAGGYQLVVFPLLLVRRGGGDGVSIGALMALQSAGMIGGNVLASGWWAAVHGTGSCARRQPRVSHRSSSSPGWGSASRAPQRSGSTPRSSWCWVAPPACGTWPRRRT